MKHRSAVLCQTALVDDTTKNISLINVIDRMTLDEKTERPVSSEQMPGKMIMVPFTASLVVYTIRTNPDQPETGKGLILIQGPQGQEIDRIDLHVDLTTHNRSRSIVHFSAFPFVGEGMYQLAVQYQGTDTEKWDEVDSVPLEVYVRERSTAEASASD